MALGVKVIFDLDNSLVKTEDWNNYSSGYSFSGDLNIVIQITGPGGVVYAGGTSSNPDNVISSSDYSPGTAISTSRKLEVTLPSTLAGGWKIDYIIYDQAGSGTPYEEEYAFTYSFSVPSGSLALTSTPSSSLISSLDSTDYNSSYTNNSIDRTHSIHPAVGAVDALGVAIPNPADTGSSATITYTGISTGTWTSSLSTIGEWQDGAPVSGSSVLSTLHYVTGTVAGGASVSIDSDVGLCDVYCCLKALNDRYEQAKCKNKELAEDYKAKIEDVTRLVTLYVQAVSCGLTGDASCYITDIKNISECGTECSCYGDSEVPANIPIVSTTSSNHIQVRTASSRLAMTASGSGTSADPVVYEMDLGASISGDINYTTQNIRTVDSRLRDVESDVQDLLDNFTGLAGSPERLTMNIVHSFKRGGMDYQAFENFNTGTRFYSLSDNQITISNKGLSEANYSSLNNEVHVTNLHDSTWRSTPFYVETRVVNQPSLTADVYLVSSKKSSGYGEFSYSIKDKLDGYILTNEMLAKYGNINISIDLISGSDKVEK